MLDCEFLVTDGHGDAGFGLEFTEGFAKGEGAFFFTVDDKNIADIASATLHVGHQFIAIRVAGEGVVPCDLRFDFIFFAKDIHRRIAIGNARAECVLCAIADEEHEVFWVLDVVFQMMPDAAAFAHSR